MSFRLGLLARRAVLAAALAGVSLMAACGDSSGPDGDNYSLYSIDDAVLPIVGHDVFVTGDEDTIKGGSLNLNGGKYTVRITETYKAPGAGLETTSYGENGTYEDDAGDLTLTKTHDYEDGELTAADTPEVNYAVRVGNTITAEYYDVDTDTYHTFVFKKK